MRNPQVFCRLPPPVMQAATGKKATDFSLKFNEKFNLMRNLQVMQATGTVPLMRNTGYRPIALLRRAGLAG